MADGFTIDDPRTLRAIAHPVRMRILERFESAGPQRAADIAEALGIPANQASFHLRQLAKYGLVVEAPEEARDGRDRVWKAVDHTVHVDSKRLAEVPGGRAAIRAFQERWVGQAHHILDQVARAEEQRPKGVATGGVTSRLTLTKEQAEALLQELSEVVERRRGEVAQPGARAYHALAVVSWDEEDA